MNFPNMRSRSFLAGAIAIILPGSLLFGGARAGDLRTETPQSQLHRLTESQYRASIADIFGPSIKIVGRFPPDLRIDGLQSVGSGAISVNAAGFEQYEDIARSTASQITDEVNRDALVGCAPSDRDKDGTQCARAFFSKVGLRLFRRSLSPQDVDIYASAAITAASQLGDFHQGLAASLAAMLSSPEFLFRIDRPDGSGRTVDSFSKATRIAFLLWNRSPDEKLLAAAAEGRLDGHTGLAAEIDRMLASPKFVEGQRAFFTDYLHLEGLDELAKDRLIYPAFTPSVASAAREQTLRTITHLLLDRDGDFRELFTSRSIAMHRSLGPIYDIPVSRSEWYIHEFPEGDPRGGLLTHASMLAQHSHPGRTSPTLRGLALSEIFLCEKVPAPPANVNFAVVQDVDNPTLKTTRARLQAHLDDEECASCHKRTDPMGLGLEQFDGAGQFRVTEHDTPIDVTGNFEKRGFNGAVALGQIFHDSSRVRACFVETAWRYAQGRNPTADDAPAIEKLTASFATENFRIRALMRMIALDPGFYSLKQNALQPRVSDRPSVLRKGEG